MTKKLISIVVPIYQEESVLRQLIERLDSVTKTLPEYDWRYVLTNDGSIDNTWTEIKKLSSENSRIVGIDLSRNFGKEIALTAGVHLAKGSDAVICIDADLQHPPELIPQMISNWCEGAEVVAAVRVGTEKEPLARRILSYLYYKLMSQISDLSMVSQTTDFRLYDSKVIDEFCRVTEHGRMFRGIIDWMGFRHTQLEFEAKARSGGLASYSYKKLWQLAFNSITSFSLWPLKFVGYLGLVITGMSGLLLAWMVTNYLISEELNYTPQAIVVVINTLLIGIVLIAIGLIALYIGSIHTEVINRPLYIVREILESDVSRSEDINRPSLE